jgi:hypothetical protein
MPDNILKSRLINTCTDLLLSHFILKLNKKNLKKQRLEEKTPLLLLTYTTASVRAVGASQASMIWLAGYTPLPLRGISGERDRSCTVTPLCRYAASPLKGRKTNYEE